MEYILLDFGSFQGYQEVSHGVVLRHTDLDGATINPPIGNGGRVIDSNCVQPTWALADAPIDNVVIPHCRMITVYAFRKRFSPAEKRRIYTAAESVVDVRIWLDDLFSVQDQMVDLDDPETQFGVQGLQTAGMLDNEGRAAEILNA